MRVSATSTAGIPSVGWIPTGMPRPSSVTLIDPSRRMTTSQRFA
jgi:hypothetical protein